MGTIIHCTKKGQQTISFRMNEEYLKLLNEPTNANLLGSEYRSSLLRIPSTAVT